MEMIRATNKDIEQLTTYYRYVSEHTSTMSRYGRWIYGMHPTDQMICQYIRNGNMYYSVKNDHIVSAVAAVPFQSEEYHGAAWKAELDDREVGTVHLLCVHPDFQRQGYSRQTMEAVKKLFREQNLKAIRLDALQSNIPARNLYKAIGYQLIGIRHWYAENTGWTDFVLYEKLINEA